MYKFGTPINLMWVWQCIVVNTRKIKGQLDATDWFLLQNLLSAQHVFSTIMSIIRSSRVIQIVAAGGTWRFGLPVVVLVWSWRFMCPGCGMFLDFTRPTAGKLKCHVPQAATICITLELLMMGIMVPETCWADNKFCNKNQSVASSWPFISLHFKCISV